MSAPVTDPHDAYAALRAPNFRDYLLGSFLGTLGRQAVTAAAAWEIYRWTNSATALGLVGLANVVPLLLFSLPAGALADRVDRLRIITRSQLALAVLSGLLALLSIFHERIPIWAPLRAGNAVLRRIAGIFEHHVGTEALHFDEPALPLMFLLLFVMAALRVLAWPARSSIIPSLLPRTALSNAITWNSSAFEIATITGPAVAGFVVAGLDFQAVYLLDAVLGLVSCLLLGRVTCLAVTEPPAAHHLGQDWLVGARFIWNRNVILGANTLDLFATLLGAATALLPVFAKEILHTGPIGLGWLQAAPSIGAFSMAFWQAHRPPLRQPGRTMLWAVAGFGVTILVFGLSHWFWVSFLALLAGGALDNISVVVRQSLIQFLTPDALRGRVTAVNQIFIGTSNEAGALRAGLMGALVGPVNAVLIGGAGTIAVVLLVARGVPALRRVPALHTLRPE
ncbi:MAG: MFS transporter [Verrucomicrobiota bacterium]